MARKQTEIKNQITFNFMNNEVIANAYDFVIGSSFENEFSLVSFENIIFEIVAFSIWTLESLFDIHKEQIDQALYEQKSGSLRWNRNKALSFQYGFDLIEDSQFFDNGDATDDQIEASKIVKYCSVKESQESNRLIMKIAADVGGVLTPLNELQKESFLAYMNEVKYGGVKINVVNNPADILQLSLKVFRDPLVIDVDGNSILNGGKPLETAISEYLKDLPFDGELVLNDFIEKLREVPGIINVQIIYANSKYYDLVTQNYTSYSGIEIKTIPQSGYFIVENFNSIDYVV
jgi:hypothetical protein